VRVLLNVKTVIESNALKSLLRHIDPRAEFILLDGEAGFGAEPSLDIDFDLLLCEVPARDTGILAALQRLKAWLSGVPIIVFFAQARHPDLIASVRTGARGVIPANTNRTLMLAAVQVVLARAIYVPPRLIGEMIASADGHASSVGPEFAPRTAHPLTNR
jgi:DNA-binding NarL/FixJ family response regulator